MALITCEKAAFAYEGRVVVDALDLTVERGEFRLYPVRTLEEALTILTGRPACRLLSRVRRHL